jgi:ceramide glucosyltransferase
MTLAWSILMWVVAGLLAGGVVCLVLGHVSAVRHYRRRPERVLAAECPKVSILKPVEGGGPGLYEALESFCRQDYPGEVEIIVGTLSAADPVVSVVERLKLAHPGVDLRSVVAELRGTNRKTSIMECLWRSAGGELLLFSDADVRVERDYLRRLVPYFAGENVGCVTCLPRGMGGVTWGGRMVALHYGFNNLPQWMLARWTTGIEWAIGHTMAVRRGVLERLDGFTGFFDHLADDYELGHRVAGLGYRVEVPSMLLDCMMPREGVRAACRRLLRWKRTMRRARGAAFLGAGLTYPVFWALGLALLQPAAAWGWGVLAGVVLLRLLLAARLQRVLRLPDWRWSWWMLPFLDVVEGLTFVWAYFGNTVFWAGRRYRLTADGRLELLSGGGAAEK